MKIWFNFDLQENELEIPLWICLDLPCVPVPGMFVGMPVPASWASRFQRWLPDELASSGGGLGKVLSCGFVANVVECCIECPFSSSELYSLKVDRADVIQDLRNIGYLVEEPDTVASAWESLFWREKA